MECDRCQGFMLQDSFLDMEESFGSIWVRAWRCLNCGHAMDAVILANRLRQTHVESPGARQGEVVQGTLGSVSAALAA
jgi:hypothetical protein